MENENNVFSQKEEETFSFFTDVLEKLKLKEDESANMKVDNNIDLYSKAHSNLADLELLLMQLKSTSEFNEEKEADLVTNINSDFEIKKEPGMEPLTELSDQARTNKIKEDSKTISENKSFMQIKIAESISFKEEEEKFEDAQDTVDENALDFNFVPKDKNDEFITEIHEVSEHIIIGNSVEKSKFQVNKNVEEVKDKSDEINSPSGEIRHNIKINYDDIKEHPEDEIEDIPELNEDIKFHSCIQLEPIKEESVKEIQEAQDLTEEIESISLIKIDSVTEENKNKKEEGSEIEAEIQLKSQPEIEEGSEIEVEIKLKSQPEISSDINKNVRSHCSELEFVRELHNDENEEIQISTGKHEGQFKTNSLIEELNISSVQIEAISINDIQDDRIEEVKLVSDSKVEFQKGEVIDDSNEFKHSTLSEIQVNKFDVSQQILGTNDGEKYFSKEIIEESAKIENQKISQLNEVMSSKEVFLPINSKLAIKIFNEESQNKSMNGLSNYKDNFEGNPSNQADHLIAETEINYKLSSSEVLKETSISNTNNLSLVIETSLNPRIVLESPVDNVMVTIGEHEKTLQIIVKNEPSNEPDLQESATFIIGHSENFPKKVEAVEAFNHEEELSIYSLHNKSDEIISEIPRADNVQCISFQPNQDQVKQEIEPSVEHYTSNFQNEPRENIQEMPYLLDQLNLIQRDSDLNSVEYQEKPNEPLEFKETSIESIFEIAKNAILQEEPVPIDKITVFSEEKHEVLNSEAPLNVFHDARIKTPFDEDDDIEEIPEIKYIYQLEESKCDSSGIVNYQRPSEPRENFTQNNLVINEFENKKMYAEILVEDNQPKLDMIATGLNIDKINPKSPNLMLETNQNSNYFHNSRTNQNYDPYQLNKSEYSVANSMINNAKDPIRILTSNQEIIKEIQKNENKLLFPNQIHNPDYIFTDNSGINNNDKSEQIEFDVKEITTFPEALPESKLQHEEKKYEDSFRLESEFKFSHEEIKQSNMTNMYNILAERKLSDLKKADVKSKNSLDDHHNDFEIDDFNDYEEVHNLTGNEFNNKNESKCLSKSPFTNARKYSNITNANKKKENLNFSNEKFNDKSVNELKHANDKYQNFRTEDYDSNNILLDLNKERGSPAPELIEQVIQSKSRIVSPLQQTGVVDDKIDTEEDKRVKNKERKSTLSINQRNQTQIKLPQDLAIINYFNIKEIKFNESIPNFSSIFLEKNFIFKRRRNSFLNNQFYEEHILKEFNIVDRYKAIPKDFQQVLEEGLRKYELTTEFKNIFKEALRNPDKTAEMMKKIKIASKEDPLIGELKPITIYLEDKDSETAVSKLSFNSLKEAMPYWRESITDGDSFYRLFIFGLLEHYILTKNKREIKKIILDICNVNSYFSENAGDMSYKVDLTNTLLVFYFILDHLDNNNIHEAYQVLTRSYHLSENEFDTKLIDYMRRIIWMNVYETEKELSLKKDYGSEKNLKLEYDPIRIDPILVFQNEPNKLPISLIPLIFNVDLDIYILDGSLGTKSEIKYIRKSFTNYKPANTSIPTISLFYNISSYHKAYPEDYFKRHEELLKPLVNQEESITNISLGHILNCEVCILKTDHAIYNKYSNPAFCVECAKAYIDSSLDKRAKIHIIENFHNREYYSRSIQLKKDIFLNDSDIYKLYNTNIASLLLKAIKTFCFFCNIKQENDLHTLSCYCQICSTCLDQILKLFDSIQVSAGKKKSISKPLCACNSTFDVNAAISILSSTDRKSSSKESSRNMDDFISRYCMKCCNVMINKGDEMSIPTTNQVFQKFHIVNEDTQINVTKFATNQHVLCYYCIDKIIKQESEENLRRRNSGNKFIINKVHKLIECNICKSNHKILLTEWNRANKATCCEGCLII